MMAKRNRKAKLKVGDLLLVPQLDALGQDRPRATGGVVKAVLGRYVAVRTPRGRIFPEATTVELVRGRMKREIEEALAEAES